MSQHTKILNLLESGNWICSSKFYAEFIADPRTRLCELKKQGYQLISRWCLAHHHEGKMKEWRLMGELQGGVVIQQHSAFKPVVDPALPSTIAFLQRFGQKTEIKQSRLF